MKKKSFALAALFLITITFFLFSNITQAKAQCNIVWWGVESGYVPTNQTYATELAAYQVFIAIYGSEPSICDYDPFQAVIFSCRTSPSPSTSLMMTMIDTTYQPDNKIWFEDSGLYGEWDVVCPELCESSGGDSDIDAICDDIDNCISIPNHLQKDSDIDGTGDACDTDTISGYVEGVVQNGATVNLYIQSCGAPQPYATAITEAKGYYAIGGLENGKYLVTAEKADYTFRSSHWADIPQTEFQSYDFTAIAD
jgi:hypothetical protein